MGYKMNASTCSKPIASLVIGIEDIKGCLIDDLEIEPERIKMLMKSELWVKGVIEEMQDALSHLSSHEVLVDIIKART